MTKTIEFLFDCVSPNAYLVWHPLQDVIERTDANLRITPVFLGGMHKLTGNAPPMIRDKDVQGKVAYSTIEMQRFIARHQLDRFTMHPQFPFNSVTLQRMLLAVDEQARARLVDVLLLALWEDGLPVDDPSALAERIEAAGFDAKALLAATQDSTIKQRLIDNTSAAVDRGAFGIPTFFVDRGEGEQIYFGKERLDQIENYLAGGPA